MKQLLYSAFISDILFTNFSEPAYAQTIDVPFIIENYYKVKWGYGDEFIELWKFNHYPLLKKSIEQGDILSVEATKPGVHSGEDSGWDFKVIITFKNISKAFSPDLTTAYKKALYPDTDRFLKNEHHRFELLIAHWDVLIEQIQLN